jgi:NifU-like N terminal domain
VNDLLAPQVRRLFGSLAHAGPPGDVGEGGEGGEGGGAERWVHGEAGRQVRGTRVRFELRLADGRVSAARYQAYGCPHTLAVCEWLAQQLEAGPATSLGGPQDWSRQLGVPTMKLGRLLVVEDALRAALAAGGITTEVVKT